MTPICEDYDNSRWELDTLREAEKIKQDGAKMARIDKYIKDQIQVLSQDEEREAPREDTNGYTVL